MQIRRNRRTGNPFITTSDAAKRWKLAAVAELARVRTQYRLPTFTEPVIVIFNAFQVSFPGADIDNIESALFDALKTAKVIQDDSLIVAVHSSKAVDALRPRIMVQVGAAT